MKTAITVILLSIPILIFAQFNYPASKTEIVTDSYFGVTYTDSYRWLVNIIQPEVAD